MINNATPSNLNEKNESELYKECSCLQCNNLGQNNVKIFYINKMIPVCDDCMRDLINMGLVEASEKKNVVFKYNVKIQPEHTASLRRPNRIIRNFRREN